MRLEVSRASQTHQMPHALRAHSGPVTSVMMPNTTASSAAASAQPSMSRFFPNRNIALAVPAMIAARRNSHAAGMWK